MTTTQESNTVTSGSHKIFYGWWVVVGCIAVAMCSSIARYGFSMFMPHILKDMGWTRAMVSGAFTLHMALYAVSAVFIGRLVDRFGARWVMFGGSFLLLSGLFMISRMTSQVQFYVFYGAIAAFGVAGTYVVPNTSTARKWFSKKAGLAVGLVMAGSGMGLVVVGPLVPLLSKAIGWRGSYVALALICGVVGMAASQLVRKDPESMGLKPDGVKPGEASSDGAKQRLASAVPDEAVWTVKGALKTKAYWVFLIIYPLFLIPQMGFISNAGAFGRDLSVASGLDLKVAGPMIGNAFMLMGAAAIISRIVAGYLVDKLGRKGILITSLALMCLCFIWVMNLHTLNSFLIFMPIFGFCYGLGIPAWVPLLADCFGRRSLGTLFGILTLCGGGLSGLGGVLFGGVFDATKSYDAAFWVSIVMFIIVIIGIAQIKPAPPKTAA